MRKLVILKHGGGELANQLWNYVSIYAYGLEMNIPVFNPSFFEYHSFFNLLQKESLITKKFALFFRTPRRRSHIINKMGRLKYAAIVKIRTLLHSSCVVSSENLENKVRYLPPSGPIPGRFGECGSLYFTGWLFRNPVGLQKWRKELVKVFAPKAEIENKVNEIISPLGAKYEKIIGIHIRQADYVDFKDGKFLISQERIREIVSEYAKENILDATKIVFVITSDGPVDESLYKNLNVFISRENSVVDLFLLSKTDVILGSDSSFGAFASWYGNIPHIVFKNEAIDWNYYADKKAYFENKYWALTRY
jgi:hypothetical protein